MAPDLLVLASTSSYRRELLLRLKIPFQVFSPGIDESPRAGEAPRDTALRLSREKALAARDQFPDALIIGSDQVAVLDGIQLGKPGNRENAQRQLRSASGREVVFHTAVSLVNARTARVQSEVIAVTVRFRRLSDDLIQRYLDKEQPYDCAGSARSEGVGIALCERIESRDPTALIGLPLITVVSMLEKEGFSVV